LHHKCQPFSIRAQFVRFCNTVFLCSVVSIVSAKSSNPSSKNSRMMAVAWKQTAAEYKALYYQAYNIARMQVDRALSTRRPGDKPLAVLMYMDDTILNTLNYWGYLINNNQAFFDDSIWDRWIPENKVVPTPGSVDFLTFCKDNDVEVFYVTSRNQGPKTYEYAMDHLKINGFPYADENHLTVLTDTSNKQERQDEIGNDYEIVLFMGDNLNDFKRFTTSQTLTNEPSSWSETKISSGESSSCSQTQRMVIGSGPSSANPSRLRQMQIVKYSGRRQPDRAGNNKYRVP